MINTPNINAALHQFAEVIDMPATGLETCARHTGPPLMAANDSKIMTYRQSTFVLHFG